MKGNTLITTKKIAFFLLILFFADCFLHFSSFSPIPATRVMILLLLFIFSFSFLLFNRYYLLEKYNLFIVLILCVTGANYLRALLLDQRIDLANDYVLGLGYLIFYPFLLYLVKSEMDLKRLLLIIEAFGSLLSFLSILIACLILFNRDLEEELFDFFVNNGFAVLVYSYGSAVRVIWVGVIIQILAFFICFLFYVYNFGSTSIIHLVLLILNFIGIFLTYSRGLYLALFCGTVVLLLKIAKSDSRVRNKIFQLCFLVVIGSVVCLALLILFGGGEIIWFAFKRIFQGTNSQESDELRIQIKELLYEEILKNPIFGNGLGSHIDFRDGRVEMVFHDIISKMGIIGLLVFFAPFFSMLYDILLISSNDNDLADYARLFLFAALTTIFIASYTNPYLITSLGMFSYCLTMRVFQNSKFRIKNKGEKTECLG